MVQFEVDYRELVRRISGRRTCADCGRVFNMLTSAPAAGELCPKTAAPHRLTQRPDDNEATVAERLRVYDEKTRPLIDFYRARGLLRVIDAEGHVDEVTRRLARALGARLPAPRRTRGASTPKAAASKRASAGAARARSDGTARRKRSSLRSRSKPAAKTARVARGKSRRPGSAGRGRLKGKRR